MSGRGTIRVVIVDDSRTVRALFKRVLGEQADIDVVGEAADGEEAVAAVRDLRPDIVVMDLKMPGMNGLEAMEIIGKEAPTPVVVVTSRLGRDELPTPFAAVNRGAVAILPKPEAPSEWEDLIRTLLGTIRGLRRGPAPAAATPRSAPEPAAVGRRLRFLGIGASTGGPGAIRDLLQSLGRDHGLGTLIVQHISAGFDASLARWLSAETGIPVTLAEDGEILKAGRVRLAPANTRVLVGADGRLTLDRGECGDPIRCAAIDHLFLSLARSHPRSSAGVLLSGMGRDGARGLAALREAGGLTFVQDQGSCVVFGMPAAALEASAASASLPPAEIGRHLRRLAARRKR